MSRRLRDLFVEPLPGGSTTSVPDEVALATTAPDPAAPATATPDQVAWEVAAPGLVPAGARAASRPRAVAVLAAPGRVQHATAAVAMGLARACGSRWALVNLVGAPTPGVTSSSPLPAARGAAARLRRAGRSAVAVGRLVWVDEREKPDEGPDSPDRTCDDLLRLAGTFGVPVVLGIALPRTAALDRALAAFDGLVVVREPDATDELEPLVLASLAALGPAVASLPAPSRVAAQLAASGMHAPSSALAAVRALLGASS